MTLFVQLPYTANCKISESLKTFTMFLYFQLTQTQRRKLSLVLHQTFPRSKKIRDNSLNKRPISLTIVLKLVFKTSHET